MALIIVQYYDDSVSCIIAVIHINFLYTVTFMTLKPYREKKENTSEIFNEVSTLIISYILMLFSEEYVQNAQVRNFIGYVLIGFTCFIVGFNCFPLVIGWYQSVKKLTRKFFYRTYFLFKYKGKGKSKYLEHERLKEKEAR